jgi:hypothetical protein
LRFSEIGMRWLAIPLILASLAMVGHAGAQLRGSTDAAPLFSAADRVVIARNEMLRLIIEQDPWLVRRALDVLATIDDVQTRTAPSGAGRSAGQSSNPDLDRLERASPEAMNDLLSVLKQASGSRLRPSR